MTRQDVCECCGYDTTLTPYHTHDYGEGQEHWYCTLCAGSAASVAMRYAHVNASIHQTICYVGNAIVSAIQKGQS